MNTGSRDERQFLTDVGRIATALERIAAAVEADVVNRVPPARMQEIADALTGPPR